MAELRKIKECVVCHTKNTFVNSEIGEVCKECEPRTKSVIIKSKSKKK